MNISNINSKYQQSININIKDNKNKKKEYKKIIVNDKDTKDRNY